MAALVCFFLFCSPTVAEVVFPPLTGRVVDNAHFLSGGGQRELEEALARYERRTSDQFVVATLPTLGGQTIEDYSVALARHWQLGQKGRNNGVLLLIADKEHAARIEVGYGLEGTLTDARSSEIIEQVMIPYFRQGQMEQGILAGVSSVLKQLGEDNDAAEPTPQTQTQTQQSSPLPLFLVLASIVVYIILCVTNPGLAWFLFQVVLSFATSSGRSRGDGGSFSGGGGSFGGGGASGKW